MMLADVNAPGALGVLFELVRTLNAAIDAGEVGKSDVAVIREAFDHFDRVLGIDRRCGAPRKRRRRCRSTRSSADRGAQATRAQRRDFARADADPPGARRARHPARGFAGGHPLETG